MVCFFFHARVVIGADAALSQGACERAARKWGPRDGADAKVLGEEGELSAGGDVKGGPFHFTLSVGIISRSSSRYMRL
jgi:hypothetical protein